MAVSLPYLPSNKNLPTLFEKIASAKIPDSFSYNFLQTTIGLKGSNDRPLIALLRNLGFIDQSSAPSPSYRRLKGSESKVAIAEGVRRAYSSLFDSDQSAHKLTGEKLKSLVAQVAGTDDSMTARIANTFVALVKQGDFEGQVLDTNAPGDETSGEPGNSAGQGDNVIKPSGLRTEFHYNIQIHLPANGTEEVYLDIFNALRKTFQ